MSRTYKSEHTSDGWNVCRRLERQARPAGRIVRLLEEEFMLDADLVEASRYNVAEVAAPSWNQPEGCDMVADPFCYVCGRCTDHFAEHCDLVELGYCYYTQDGSVMLTETGRTWLISQS